MDEIDLDCSVPDWLIDHPELLPLFRELGLDYCCGGKSLSTACRDQRLDPQHVLARCRALLETASQRSE
jgi:iron-sulfur cluster repair protein YtfE (RIC family)